MDDLDPEVQAKALHGGLRHVLPLVLVVPLVVVPAIAYFALSSSGSSGVPIAQGAIGGVFHPVAGNFVPDKTALGTCNEAYSCLEQAFGNVSYYKGPKRALALFQARLGPDPAVTRDCHRIAHTIGSAAFARFHGNVARTFAVGSAICASGYYHGILERAFVGITTKAGLESKAQKLCVAAEIRRRSFLDYQCRHGLGHGFMIQTGYALPMALSLCRGLGTHWDEVTCTSGVFMENAGTRFGFRSPWLKTGDPLYPCDSVDARYRKSCYVRATTWILQVNGNDFGKAARTCLGSGKRWAPFCFRGFGRDAVADQSYRPTDRVLRLCALAGGYEGQCLYGAARTFGDGAALAGVRTAARFCARAPSALRDDCVGGYGIVVGLLYPTDTARHTACVRLDRAHAGACTRAAIAEVDPSGRGAWG